LSQLPRLVRSVVLVASASSFVSDPAHATTYIFSTFKGDTEPEEKLSIYTSTDALNFTLLSDTGFEGSSSTLRDPSIMKYSDGKYYVAYTNPPTASCCGNADHFSIAVSTDLVSWQDVATVRSGVSGVAHTWAPEWLVGDDVVKVIANIDTGNGDFKPYVFTPLDATLTSWSGPTLLGIGPNYIDTCVVKSGTTYHAFTKNETTRFMEHATASALTGPWTFVATGDWAGLGAGGFEGPTVVKRDDGTWRMYLDPQTRGVPCTYMDSRDLNSWSAPARLPGAAGLVVRHGTVIRDEARSPPAGGGGVSGAADGGDRADAANDVADAAAAGDGGSSDAARPTGSGGTGGSGASIGSGGVVGGTGGRVGTGGDLGTDAGTGSRDTQGSGGANGGGGAPVPGGGCGCAMVQAVDARGTFATSLLALLLAVRRRHRDRR
jgi:MYXO-CTERM domain-containing protein